MALQAREITPQKIADVDKANVDVSLWFDDDWRCAEDAQVRYPSASFLRGVVESSTHALVVVVETTEASKVYGIAVVRLADARVVWLVAEKTRFGAVVSRLCQAVASRTGLQPWGVLERAVIQQRFVDSGYFEAFDYPNYPGMAFRFIG